MTTTDISASRTIRPLRHLHWYRAAIGNIGLVVPGAAAGIFIAVRNGDPAPAAALAVIVAATVAVVLVPVMRIRLVLDRVGIRASWKRKITRQEVRRAVMRTVYNGDGVTTTRHLFLLDPAGSTVLRLSDRWWSHDQMLTVARHFAVSLENQEQPVQFAELRRTAPNELRWHERHQVIAGTALVACGFLSCLAFAALLAAATR